MKGGLRVDSLQLSSSLPYSLTQQLTPPYPDISSQAGTALNRLGPTDSTAPTIDPLFNSLMGQQAVTSNILMTLLHLLTQLLGTGANSSQTGASSGQDASGVQGSTLAGKDSVQASGGAARTASPSTSATPGPGGFVNPIDGELSVSSEFGPRNSPTSGASEVHSGIDLPKPTGTPIRAVKGGTVNVSKADPSGYGEWIEIRHDDGTSTRYAHMSKRDVSQGAKVQQGQVIGQVGSTGNSTGPHLHFEYRNSQGQAVNPREILKL